MSGKNNKKTMVLIASAIGAIMGIYVKTLNEIRKDLMQDKKKEDCNHDKRFYEIKK